MHRPGLHLEQHSSLFLCAQVGAGTPAYMAPELLSAGKPYSTKADIYALGVMLNEMLARSPPWPGTDAASIRRQV